MIRWKLRDLNLHLSEETLRGQVIQQVNSRERTRTQLGEILGQKLWEEDFRNEIMLFCSSKEKSRQEMEMPANGSDITNPPLRTDCILLDRSSPTSTNILLWIFSNRQNSLKTCMVNCLLYMLCHILIPSSLHSSILFSHALQGSCRVHATFKHFSMAVIN